jgi:hypothetical protein
MQFNYQFLSYLRTGLASKISDATDGRAKVDVTLRLSQSTDGYLKTHEIANKAIQLYGPGDITGFDSRVVARTEPKHGSHHIEPNYFPFIEFTDADFLWRYTPYKFVKDESTGVTASTPWIALVVLAKETSTGDQSIKEYSDGDIVGKDLPPYIKVNPKKVLPDLNYAWRWAHVPDCW